MTDFKFKVRPKPWEISLSRGLSPILGVSHIAAIVYTLILLFAPTIVWTQVLIMVMLVVAINFALKNVNAILGLVNDDKTSGE
jgi:hypothetical protein